MVKVESMPTAKTCPNCGAEPKLVPICVSIPDTFCWAIRCESCGLEQSQMYDTRTQAINAWNKEQGENK